jgi:integrase
MALTQPIKNKKHLRQLADYFISSGQYRNHLLLIISSHTALRISDILRLTWEEVYNEACEEFCTQISIAEKKTGKRKTIALHPKIIEALRIFYPHRRGKYIFASNRKSMAAISRVQAWRILHAAAEALKLGISVTCHGLRKCFGYHAWKGGVSPVLIMNIYNHSNYEVTRRYLGISQDDIDMAYLSVTMF